MTTLYVHGILDAAPPSSDLGRGVPGRVTVRHAARVDSARAERPCLSLVQADDIVEIEFEDGLRLWSRADWRGENAATHRVALPPP